MQIVLTGDIFRTVSGEPMQLANVEWLRRELAPTLWAVSGIEPIIVFPGTSDSSATITDLYAALGERPGLDAWAKSFWTDPSPNLVDALASSYLGAIVISIELSPLMESVLNKLDVPWIDVGISPLRFMQDFAISFRYSGHFKDAFPSRFALTDQEVETSVARVRSHYSKSTESLSDSLVFFAQTEQDRTLIRDGRFVNADDITEWLDSKLGERRLLIKPHPWAPNNPLVSRLMNEFHGAITELNTYDILSNSASDIVTVSSSVGREAAAFGCATHTFHTRVQDWAYSGPASMRHGLSPSLWSQLLKAVIETQDVPDHLWQPNKLRSGLGQFGLASEIWA